MSKKNIFLTLLKLKKKMKKINVNEGSLKYLRNKSKSS